MNGVPKLQPVTPQQDGWNFNGSNTNESALKPICQEVEKHFALPTRRLYRYFAVEDDLYLAGLMGAHFRGFHIPLSGRNDLPEYLRECFFRPFEEYDATMTFEQMVAFDNLIYVRYDTCSNTVGCVITYAHELQHFMQYGHTPRLWAVNSALYHNLGAFDATATPIDIPHEREANVISKRVAEKICGEEAVRKYAQEQIRLMEAAHEPAQAARLVFFRDVIPSTEYGYVAVRAEVQGPDRFWDRRYSAELVAWATTTELAVVCGVRHHWICLLCFGSSCEKCSGGES